MKLPVTESGEIREISIDKKISEALAWQILIQPPTRVFVDSKLPKGTIKFTNPYEYPRQVGLGRCFQISEDVWHRWSTKYERDTGQRLIQLPTLVVAFVSYGY